MISLKLVVRLDVLLYFVLYSNEIDIFQNMIGGHVFSFEYVFQWNVRLDINVRIHLNACKSKCVFENDVWWNVCFQMVNTVYKRFVQKVVYCNTKH